MSARRGGEAHGRQSAAVKGGRVIERGAAIPAKAEIHPDAGVRGLMGPDFVGRRRKGWTAATRPGAFSKTRITSAKTNGPVIMDFALSAEQEMIVETVRGFVASELVPLEAVLDRAGDLPIETGREIARKVQALGFYAPNMPAAVGGGGLDCLTMTLLERELGRTAMALSVWWGRPSNILCACDEGQRERYLLPCVRGEKIDCLAITEPGAGSDVRAIATTARADGGDWVLNGTKHFISHADIADFAIVFAATGEEEAGGRTRKRIGCFLVDRGTPGFAIRPGYRSVAHRGYHNATLVFDDCRLPAAQMLGGPGEGMAIMNTWLFATRLTVAAMCVGRARRVFDLAVDWAANRRQFGQPIGAFQGTGFKLADMITEIDAADWLTLAAAWAVDQGQDANRQIASAKLYASEMLGRVTDHTLQIYGGMGLMDELPIERFWRDARVERIWDGTSEIQRHIIARTLLRGAGA
jgi:acyl-CoA dehydrogenase